MKRFDPIRPTRPTRPICPRTSGSAPRRRALRAPFLTALVACAALAGAVRADTPPPAPTVALDAAQLRAERALIETALTRLHPGYARYATAADRAAIWRDYDAALGLGGDNARAADAAPITDRDAYHALSRLLAAIRCGHTKAEVPKAYAAYRRAQPTHLPFRFRLFGDRMIVVGADDPRLPRGARVRAIDDVAVEARLAQLRPLVAVDGVVPAAVDASLVEDGDLLGSAFDHYLPFVDRLRHRFRLRVEPPGGGAAQTIDVSAVTFDAWRALPGARTAWRGDFVDAVRLETLDARTALLRIDTFVNYRRPVDPIAHLAPYFRQLRADGVDRLILDLRRNGGGSEDAAYGLMRLLMPTPFRMKRPSRVRALDVGDALRPYVDTWDPSALALDPATVRRVDDGWALGPALQPAAYRDLQPHPDRFTGTVVALTTGTNGSGSTNVLAKLRDADRATLIGEPTGGNAAGPTAGVIAFLRLPHSGITMRVPLRRVINDVDAMAGDHGPGVPPHIAVAITEADLLIGRDPVLEAARRWLRRGDETR
ncbi:MAG: S41 family peptidase [Acidobacteriota bacterium]